MKLIFLYARLYISSTLRNVPSVFFTLVFPPLMLMLTAHQWDESSFGKLEAFIVFCNYSVQTVALMLVGMSTSQEKYGAWSRYVRTLPVGSAPMIWGRFCYLLCIAGLGVSSLGLISALFLDIPLTFRLFSYFALIALFGNTPMVFMGLSIGYLANQEGARTIFTLVNLLLLFGSFGLPGEGIWATLRQLIPSYQVNQLSRGIFDSQVSFVGPIGCSALYTVVFALLFLYAYKRHATQKEKA